MTLEEYAEEGDDGPYGTDDQDYLAPLAMLCVRGELNDVGETGHF